MRGFWPTYAAQREVVTPSSEEIHAVIILGRLCQIVFYALPDT